MKDNCDVAAKFKDRSKYFSVYFVYKLHQFTCPVLAYLFIYLEKNKNKNVSMIQAQMNRERKVLVFLLQIS